MLTSFAFVTRKFKTIQKIDKNIDYFNGILRKNVNYDNTKSHKKTGVYHLSRRYMIGKTTEGSNLVNPKLFKG